MARHLSSKHRDHISQGLKEFYAKHGRKGGKRKLIDPISQGRAPEVRVSNRDRIQPKRSAGARKGLRSPTFMQRWAVEYRRSMRRLQAANR